MRAYEFLSEKIVHHSRPSYAGDWMNTVVAINPSKTEFWSLNFRQGKDGPADTPSAAGVILADGTLVVGTGHALSHETICELAGLDINYEWMRLQIYGGVVVGEIWLSDNTGESVEEVIAILEQEKAMTTEQIKQKISSITNKIVPSWPVELSVWVENGLRTISV